MKATKVTLNITTESLSLDTIRGLLSEVVENIDNEKDAGYLKYDDGDSIRWSIERKEFEV